MLRARVLAAGATLFGMATPEPVAAAATPALPWPWSWDKISTFTYGTNTSCCSESPGNASCCSGIDSPEEIQWKLRYDLVLIDNELTAPACKNDGGTAVNWTRCNDFRSARARDIHRADPSKPVFVYRGGPFGCDMAAANGAANPSPPAARWYDYLADPPLWRTVGETWLVDRFGVVNTGVCDFRLKAAQNYWLTQMVFGPAEPGQAAPPQRWLKDPNIRGMFSDSGLIMGWGGDRLNITVGDVREIFNGTCAVMRRMAEHLNAEGKFLTFSLKDHFSSIKRTGGGTSGGTLCDPGLNATDPIQDHPGCFPYGEEVLLERMGDAVWIPFREYNIPSRDFGKDNATAQPDGCSAAVEDHAMESRRLPTMACNNDGALNATRFPSPLANGTTSWLDQHRVSLAAHLLGMEEYSYFGSGMHWDDPGWHVWWPEYDRPLGPPKGPFERSGYKFSRSFERLDVTLDCTTLATTFRWH